MIDVSRHKRIELSAGNVTMTIEKADHWDEAEIKIGCKGTSKALLTPDDIECLKMLIEEYESKYKEE